MCCVERSREGQTKEQVSQVAAKLAPPAEATDSTLEPPSQGFSSYYALAAAFVAVQIALLLGLHKVAALGAAFALTLVTMWQPAATPGLAVEAKPEVKQRPKEVKIEAPTGPLTEQPLVPKEAVSQFQPPQDLVIIGEAEHQQRKMFQDCGGKLLNFSEFENRQLNLLHQHWQQKGFRPLTEQLHRQRDRKDLTQVLRFLQGSAWSVEEATDALTRYVEWRNSLPDHSDLRKDVEVLFRSGAIYWHGRDVFLRPVLVIRTLELAKMTQERALQLVVYWLEFGVDKLMVPGKVEQWVVVVDLTGVSASAIPVSTLKTVMSFLQKNYRARLGKAVVVSLPWMLQMMVSVVKGFIKKTTADKIDTYAEKDPRSLRELIPRGQLEDKFGGAVPDAAEFHWPVMPPVSSSK